MGTLQNKKETGLPEGISGIYIITNKINNKVYIGQSVDIRTRWWNHRCELNRNNHYNRHLQGAWNKYGEDNFDFSILEECTQDDLNNREVYWIDKYNSTNPKNGYNLSTGGDCSTRGISLTQEQKDYMSKVKNPDKVVQIDFNGNLVKVWRSATHVQRTFDNIRARTILQCCRHICYQAGGYIWFYKDEYDNIENFDVEQYMFEHNRYFDIPILQYDLFGNLLKEWSQEELRNSDENISGIKRCCRHERNVYGNYIWIYKYDKEFNLTNEYLHHCRKCCGLYYIDQFDKDMNFIKTWSAKELQDDGNNIYSINKVCRNEYKCNTYKGYIWKYNEDNLGEVTKTA